MNITSFVQRASLVLTLLAAPLAMKSYVLMDAASGEVLVEHNGDERLPPASLTKLMTAYIATLEIRNGKIGEQDLVTISEHAWRTGGAASGGSTMFLPINSQVSVDDLLHGIIIQSGNDASVADHAIAMMLALGRLGEAKARMVRGDWAISLGRDLYGMAYAGLLECMYGGVGGEILAYVY